MLETDVLLVGGGVAGLTLASELANTGKTVMILEAGGQDYNAELQDSMYTASSDSQLFPRTTISRLAMLGGSSNHWENNTSPLDPEDFLQRSWVPNSGWPITFEDLQPYYNKAGSYCGVGSDGYESAHWSQRLNLPLLTAGSEKLTTGIAKASIPPTHFFVALGESLQAASNTRIVTDARVTEFLFDTATSRITGVQCQSSTGQRWRVDADQVVLCMGGIENARMLLLANVRYNNRIGNQGDCVGRYFMEHPTVRAAHMYPVGMPELGLYEGRADDDRWVVGYFKLAKSQLSEMETTNLRMPITKATEYTISEGIAAFHALSYAARDLDWPAHAGAVFGSLFADLDMVLEALARRAFDTTLFDHAREKIAYQSVSMVEQSPDPNNRVTLSSNKDPYGLPRVHVRWRVSERDKARVWRTLDATAMELGRLGLARMRVMRQFEGQIWGSQMGFAHHHMGSTRMADSPEHGVCDKHCRVFGTENLYLAGSSVFSTGGHVPPTLTIVALACRLADYLKED